MQVAIIKPNNDNHLRGVLKWEAQAFELYVRSWWLICEYHIMLTKKGNMSHDCYKTVINVTCVNNWHTWNMWDSTTKLVNPMNISDGEILDPTDPKYFRIQLTIRFWSLSGLTILDQA